MLEIKTLLKESFFTTAKTAVLSALLVSSPLCYAQVDSAKLKEIVGSRSSDEQARDKYRNPIETLTFFQVEPGMNVAEALPGGGWYTKILVPYLGSDGGIFGVNYVDSMWQRFGFFSEKAIQSKIEESANFPMKIKSYTDNEITAQGFTFNSVPEDAVGKIDRILFIRALHNLNRFENEASTMTTALESAYKLLASDGLIGVVQHRADEDMSNSWADGSNGYLKQSLVISLFEKAGFELVGSSEINANYKDKPSEDDIVWRLPPGYATSKDKPELKAKMTSIGESDRMTLLFKKTVK